MSAIDIKGVKVFACHGVLDSEKTSPQLFSFDIAIDCDTLASAKSDDVSLTVNYAEVCTLVADYCKNNSFNLIERLAYGCAKNIAQTFPIIKKVSVTVHKPQAPIPLPFDDVSVTAEIERTQVILSLGSSEGDREATLNNAIARLSKTDGIKVLKVSDFIQTKPYGGVAQNEFINCAVSAECLLTAEELLDVLHNIEEEFGRVRQKRWADRTLDMDIVFFGDKIIEKDGLCIPHPDYQNRGFVLNPVKQIAPSFVCPLTHKRMSDL
ncbi:MAG: 2-amino-4-hydroxy-6-hydroxymethyldihydropteridine diphosphokinase [Candidatus Coproplasma sp.]